MPSAGIHAAAASDSTIPSTAKPAGSAVSASGPIPLTVSTAPDSASEPRKTA